MKLKRKDTKGKKKAKKAAPYVRRTLEDERVHRHLSDAAAGLSKAYRRAARQPGAKAVEDKKLYDHVRGALGSIDPRRAGDRERAGARAPQASQAQGADRRGPRRHGGPRGQEGRLAPRWRRGA